MVSSKANDSFPVWVAAGQYKDQEYILYDVNGVPRLCKGVYIVVDGGYEKLGHMMCPKPYAKWSEWMESCRKNVECIFEIFKAC